MKIRFSEIL